MSEPVGSAPRAGYSGNSHKSREAKKVEEAPKEKLGKVIEGKVVTKKPSVMKRAVHSMVADDAQNVGDFLLVDVIVPAVKNMIADMVGQGINLVLFGQPKARRSGASYSRGERTAYNRFSSEPEPRQISRESRARHDFQDFVLETRSEGLSVLEGLRHQIAQYNRATVSDLYDLLGVSGSWTDQEWGWTNLDNADVRSVRGGFELDLPRPVAMR